MIIQHSNTTENTTTCCTLKQQSTCYIMPPKKKKVPKRIPSENTKRATKALRPLQPVDPVDPDELEDSLAPPDEIPRDSDSVESSKIYEAKPSKRVNLSKHTRMCDNSSITRTKVGGTVCKPCKCPVNRVKVVFNRTRP